MEAEVKYFADYTTGEVRHVLAKNFPDDTYTWINGHGKGVAFVAFIPEHEGEAHGNH